MLEPFVLCSINVFMNASSIFFGGIIALHPSLLLSYLHCWVCWNLPLRRLRGPFTKMTGKTCSWEWVILKNDWILENVTEERLADGHIISENAILEFFCGHSREFSILENARNRTANASIWAPKSRGGPRAGGQDHALPTVAWFLTDGSG